MVAARTELFGWRQQVVQMALPAGRVGPVGVDVAERPRHVDDRLDAAPESAAGLRRAGPQRLEHGEHVGGGDLIDWDVAERRGVLAQRLPPLPHVLSIAPRRFVRRDELVSHRAESRRCARLRGLGGGLCHAGISLLDVGRRASQGA